MEIKENILPIGTCGKCNKTIFMFLKSRKENISKYYCENQNCKEPGDLSNPGKGDIFFFPPNDIVKVLIDTYGKDAEDIFSEEIND